MEEMKDGCDDGGDVASVEIQKMTPMRVFVPSGSHKFSQIFLFLSKSTSKITEFLRTLRDCVSI